MALEPFK